MQIIVSEYGRYQRNKAKSRNSQLVELYEFNNTWELKGREKESKDKEIAQRATVCIAKLLSEIVNKEVREYGGKVNKFNLD